MKDPNYIKCDVGVLLIDGWYGVARKIHYAADSAMALPWGLGCGFGSLMPYVYFFFFAAMITHRTIRDETRCQQKYGATWEKYLKAVPCRFVQVSGDCLRAAMLGPAVKKRSFLRARCPAQSRMRFG